MRCRGKRRGTFSPHAPTAYEGHPIRVAGPVMREASGAGRTRGAGQTIERRMRKAGLSRVWDVEFDLHRSHHLQIPNPRHWGDFPCGTYPLGGTPRMGRTYHIGMATGVAIGRKQGGRRLEVPMITLMEPVRTDADVWGVCRELHHSGLDARYLVVDSVHANRFDDGCIPFQIRLQASQVHWHMVTFSYRARITKGQMACVGTGSKDGGVGSPSADQPHSHPMEWASMIPSTCRAHVTGMGGMRLKPTHGPRRVALPNGSPVRLGSMGWRRLPASVFRYLSRKKGWVSIAQAMLLAVKYGRPIEGVPLV